jgi:hypothetical protein
MSQDLPAHDAPAQYWQLPNGDAVTVEMDVPEESIRAAYQGHSSQANWYVNSRVERSPMTIAFAAVPLNAVQDPSARPAFTCVPLTVTLMSLRGIENLKLPSGCILPLRPSAPSTGFHAVSLWSAFGC